MINDILFFMLVRLQKYIADQGICSRRKAEVLIGDGKVEVNGEIVREMGVKIDPDNDKVVVLGSESRPCLPVGRKPKAERRIYIALNKPVDYITSASNEQGRSVLDLIAPQYYWKLQEKKQIKTRVYPVGRLDKDSEGLVLLTNDGELTNLLTHPKYEHEKEYEVTIDKMLSRDARKVLTSGMQIEDDYVQGIKILKEFNKGRRVIITLILKEGKNRQIRRMFGLLGYHVISLRRTRIGKLKLGTLPIGRWRLVDKEKIV